MLDQSTLDAERVRLQLATNAGLPMPVAGGLVWAVVAGLSLALPFETWVFAACFSLGAIFPIAMALQGPLKAPFMSAKSALNGVLGPAILTANLHWPVTIGLIYQAPELFPLAFGLSTAPIWAVMGWQYKSVMGWVHLGLRVPGVIALAILAPDTQTAALWIPAFVTLVYVISVIGFWREVSARRQDAAVTE